MVTELLTADEAAARLNMSERTLRKLRQAGEIAYIALTDRMFRYTPEDCDNYLAARRRKDDPCPSAGARGGARVNIPKAAKKRDGFLDGYRKRRNG